MLFFLVQTFVFVCYLTGTVHSFSAVPEPAEHKFTSAVRGQRQKDPRLFAKQFSEMCLFSMYPLCDWLATCSWCFPASLYSACTLSRLIKWMDTAVVLSKKHKSISVRRYIAYMYRRDESSICLLFTSLPCVVANSLFSCLFCCIFIQQMREDQPS